MSVYLALGMIMTVLGMNAVGNGMPEQGRRADLIVRFTGLTVAFIGLEYVHLATSEFFR